MPYCLITVWPLLALDIINNLSISYYKIKKDSKSCESDFFLKIDKKEQSTIFGNWPVCCVKCPVQRDFWDIFSLAYYKGKQCSVVADEHIPFNIWILRYNISLQSFHKVFVISCSVKLFHLFLLDICFVLEGRQRILLLFLGPWM